MSASSHETTRAPGSTQHPVRRIVDFLSGFGLATILLLLLALLTWFATLEQIDNGLHQTLRKYFHWKALWLNPEIKGRMVPLPLPGGYWVCALLFVNLTLGGVVRIRKGWKHVGNLISHLGILMLLVAGGVAHHASERGNMPVREGEQNDAAEDYFEYVIEIAEILDGKPNSVRVIRGKHIDDLHDGRQRLIRLPGLPFDLEVASFITNALPVSVRERAPSRSELVCDGYYLMERPEEVNAEANAAACYARIVRRDGSKDAPFILAGASFHPFTVRDGERMFTIDMRKRLWPMPFTVRLDQFTAEFHPGTMKPAKFVSRVTRIHDHNEVGVTIQMNEPMRHEGLTFYQASYGPPGAGPGQELYSVFEVVKNPADQWPAYSLYIVSFGMLITFLTKLGGYIASRFRSSPTHG
jgi:hypothetical protein